MVSDMPERAHPEFGGSWTEKKLDSVRRYLVAYKTALKKMSFHLCYIDAFAGTGYCEGEPEAAEDAGLFPELADSENQAFLDGSARIALCVEPPFDEYLFIEKSPKRSAQ